MARTKGSFSLAGALEPLISAPLDAREQVSAKAELTTSGNFPYPYVGMEVYVVAEDKKYRLMGADPTDIENWKEIGEGSGGTTDYTDLTNKPSINGTTLSGNKTASDLGLQDAMQLSTMPTASVDYLGKVVQYTGASITDSYTHGYFYECVSDGETTPTYSWEQTDVQPPNGGGSYTAGDGINISQENVISTDSLQEDDMDDIIDPLPSPVTEGHDLGDIEDVNITNPANGDVLKYNSETEEWENGEGGGDAELEESITTNLAVGAVPSGTTLTQGMSFTDVMKKLFITEIAPTITFSASGSGVKEVGTSVTPTLTLTISDVGTGTPASIKFYDGSTLLDTQAYVSGTNSYTFTMDAVTTTKTVKGVLEYKKSDDSTASIEKSATYTFVMASYYGAVTTAPIDKSGITALTKNVKNTKAQTATFTLSNQRSCYCYPASFGALTSIKDGNNFEYINSYTKTTVSVDGVDYNVYTLTDPVTASGFKQIYA